MRKAPVMQVAAFAAGLARHGDIRAVDTLLEMLDADQIVVENNPEFTRSWFVTNALKATQSLAKWRSIVDSIQLVVSGGGDESRKMA